MTSPDASVLLESFYEAAGFHASAHTENTHGFFEIVLEEFGDRLG